MGRRSENFIRDRRVVEPGGGGNDLLRCILLEDLVSGGEADAAVTRYQQVDEIQQVSLEGTVESGTFQLEFDGETTGDIDFDATAAAMTAALEALANIDPGDVLVKAYDGRWLVRFTGQYAGTDVPLMTVASNDLDVGFNAVRVTSAFAWIDANRTVSIHCQIPVGTPTPLKAGVIVTAGWLRDASRWGIVNVECRDLVYGS